MGTPTGTGCLSWCNQWTCTDSNCGGCSTCATLSAGTHCEGFCNDYACDDTSYGGFKMCAGCSFCSATAVANRCQSWCSIYTCSRKSDCQGCPICATPTSWCEGWCNAHT